MRKTRELTWIHYIVAALPVVAVVCAIYVLVRQPPGAHGPKVAKGDKIEKSEKAEKHDKHDKHDKSDSHEGSRKIASDAHGKSSKHDSASSKKVTHDSGELEDSEDIDEVSVTKPTGTEHGSSLAFEGATNDAVAHGADCAAIEYRGLGPDRTRVTKGEWITVMDQFHAAKHGLLSWLEKRKREVPAPVFEAMSNQVKNLKIQRPPAAEEPDLSWRGIGVYTQNSEGEPIVKLGGGFVRLSTRHPARARFEMSRLVAQSWAPCEMSKLAAGAETTWSPLLKCLGVNESQGCGAGTYSEGGWAISTTLAKAVAGPGCLVPAFKDPSLAKCAATLPLGAAHASREVASEHSGHSEHSEHGAEQSSTHTESHTTVKKESHHE